MVRWPVPHNLFPPINPRSYPSLSQSPRPPVHPSFAMYVQCSAVQTTLILDTHLEIRVPLAKVRGGGERCGACEVVSEVPVSVVRQSNF